MRHHPHRTARLVAVLILGVMLLGGCSVSGPTSPPVTGIAGGHLDRPDHPTNDRAGTQPAAETVQGPGVVFWPAPLPATDDPMVYSRAVARAVLAWDTRTGLATGDHAAPVLADATVEGVEWEALAADLAGYLPAAETWQELRGHTVVQTVTILDVTVPTVWPAILGSPAGRQLPDGTTAVTVTAIRHRHGLLDGQPVTSDRPIVFTVFLSCPDGGVCSPLRLSRVGERLW